MIEKAFDLRRETQDLCDGLEGGQDLYDFFFGDDRYFGTDALIENVAEEEADNDEADEE